MNNAHRLLTKHGFTIWHMGGGVESYGLKRGTTRFLICANEGGLPRTLSEPVAVTMDEGETTVIHDMEFQNVADALKAMGFDV